MTSTLFFAFYKPVVAQTVKRLPAMRDTRVRFLGWEGPLEKEMTIHFSTLAWKIPWTEEPDRLEDPLEKEMAIHFSTLAWKIPWTEEPDRLQSMGLQRVGHD